MKDSMEKGIESGMNKLSGFKDKMNGHNSEDVSKSLIENIKDEKYPQAASDLLELTMNNKTVKKVKQVLENADYKQISISVAKVVGPILVIAGGYYLYTLFSKSRSEES